MKQESSGLEKGNIGGYRLLAELGKGATARVFRVEQPGGKDVYALKYGSCKARLRAESAILKQLRHPCFPRWIDEGEDAGGIYLVMEFIPGLSLQKLMELYPAGMPERMQSGRKASFRAAGREPMDTVRRNSSGKAQGLRPPAISMGLENCWPSC